MKKNKPKILIPNESCPVARSLAIIGDRWTILILRDLFKKKESRYNEFQESLVGISPNLLSSRLKKLEFHELIQKNLYSDHPPRYIYSLAKKGIDLGPILKGLWDWGLEHTRSD